MTNFKTSNYSSSKGKTASLARSESSGTNASAEQSQNQRTSESTLGGRNSAAAGTDAVTKVSGKASYGRENEGGVSNNEGLRGVDASESRSRGTTFESAGSSKSSGASSMSREDTASISEAISRKSVASDQDNSLKTSHSAGGSKFSESAGSSNKNTTSISESLDRLDVSSKKDLDTESSGRSFSHQENASMSEVLQKIDEKQRLEAATLERLEKLNDIGSSQYTASGRGFSDSQKSLEPQSESGESVVLDSLKAMKGESISNDNAEKVGNSSANARALQDSKESFDKSSSQAEMSMGD